MDTNHRHHRFICITGRNYCYKGTLSKDAFNDYGWKNSFLGIYHHGGYFCSDTYEDEESPLFAKQKAEGKTSVNPLKKFGHKLNFKFVLLALFGATMGQGVVFGIQGSFMRFFIQTTLSVDVSQASKLIMWALLFCHPFYCIWCTGDRIGRKWIMLIGMLIAIVSYRFIYSAMYDAGSIKMKRSNCKNGCEYKSSCRYKNIGDSIKTTNTSKEYEDGTTYKEDKVETIHADKTKADAAKDVKSLKQ